MKEKKRVAGIGEVLWDVFPDRKILGGAPANFAYHAAQFGLDGIIVSAVGEDALGQEALSVLQEKNLHFLLQQPDKPTGSVEVRLDRNGVAAYRFAEDTAWDHLGFTEGMAELAAGTAAVCFGSLGQRSRVSRETIRRFIRALPEESLKIFDLNLRQDFYSEELIVDSLGLSDLLKINEEELDVLARMFALSGSETDQLGRLAVRFALQGVILTKGTEGSFIFLDGRSTFRPTPVVTVADTVGAGDSFTAAFTAAYLSGVQQDTAHDLAVEVSAYVCTQPGAMPVIPEEIRKKFSL